MRYKDLTGLQAPTALAPLEAIDEISMVAAPGVTDPVVQGNIIDHCENLHDRVAILDAIPDPGDLTEGNIKVMTNTDYGALYFPRIKVFDIVTKLTNPDVDEGEIYVSPSGHVAGIYARVDHTRGVHKAPANEPIHGALGLEHQISKALQDGLNPGGINCIRNINGKINVWGARTIGGDLNGDTKYVSTRRLLIFLEKSIDHGTQWVVFEPNDRSLWAKIERNVTAFLTTVWRDGALFGSTPQEAFYVTCNDNNNPPEERDLGKVTIDIGVAIVKPAEFVIFRIQQWAGPAAQ
jgi:Bacteriophage tail sheath protein